MKKIVSFILPAFTVLFFGAMLFLTIFSEAIHAASLPRVKVTQPETKMFSIEYTDENGETVSAGSQTKAALPMDVLEGGVYVVYSAEKNGSKRNFVKYVSVETGTARDDGYVEIVSGVDLFDKIVVDSTVELCDGMEVVIE